MALSFLFALSIHNSSNVSLSLSRRKSRKVQILNVFLVRKRIRATCDSFFLSSDGVSISVF